MVAQQKTTPRFNTVVCLNKTQLELVKKVIYNHMLVYNLYLDWLCNNKTGANYTDEERWSVAEELIKTHNIGSVCCSALKIELFYLTTKFLKGNLKEKLLTDIQYLTFKGKNSDFELKSGGELVLHTTTGCINGLILPVIPPKIHSKWYVNLSYSHDNEELLLKIF